MTLVTSAEDFVPITLIRYRQLNVGAELLAKHPDYTH